MAAALVPPMGVQMDSGELEVLRGDVDALVAELATERLRHVAGIEAEPSLAALFRAHGRAAHKDMVKALKAEGEKDLATRVAALRVERAQAEDEEAWRAAEAKSSARGPDGVVSLADAQLAIAGERDRERRLALGRAVADAASLAARDAAA